MMYNGNTPDTINYSSRTSNKKHRKWRNHRNHIERNSISVFEEQPKDCQKSQLSDDYLDLANIYIALGRYEKGKTCLLKAKELLPKKGILFHDTLSHVNRLSQDTSHQGRHTLFRNNAQVESCLQRATQCLENGSREEAQAWISHVLKFYFPNLDNQHETQNFNNLNSKPPFYRRRSYKTEMPPDVNKEEAKRCIEIAEQHLANRDYDKSSKFLEKAKKLYPSKQVDERLAALQRLIVQEKERQEKERKEKERKEKKRQYDTQNFNERNNKPPLYRPRSSKIEMPPDVNKYEAERCMEIAAQHLANKDYDKTRRFLEKAKKLYSSKQVDERLAALQRLIAQEKERQEKEKQEKERQERYKKSRNEAYRCIMVAKSLMAQSKYDEAERILLKVQKLYPDVDVIVRSLLEELKNLRLAEERRRQRGFESREEQKRKAYSVEDLRWVQKVMGCREGAHYDILQVSKNATFEEIRKAYKLLSLKLHPDKNCAPGAEEAFKMMKKAYTLLSSGFSQSQQNAPPPKQDSQQKGSSANEKSGDRSRSGIANEEPKAKPKQGFANEEPKTKPKWGFANEESKAKPKPGFANEEPKAKPKPGFANEEPKAKPKQGFANEKPKAKPKPGFANEEPKAKHKPGFANEEPKAKPKPTGTQANFSFMGKSKTSALWKIVKYLCMAISCFMCCGCVIC